MRMNPNSCLDMFLLFLGIVILCAVLWGLEEIGLLG